jgi:hypothetical protein
MNGQAISVSRGSLCFYPFLPLVMEFKFNFYLSINEWEIS